MLMLLMAVLYLLGFLINMIFASIMFIFFCKTKRDIRRTLSTVDPENKSSVDAAQQSKVHMKRETMFLHIYISFEIVMFLYYEL